MAWYLAVITTHAWHSRPCVLIITDRAMCFSANASFTASAMLATAGTLSLTLGRRRGQWAFGAVPLIFAVQQFMEGFLWLRLVDGDPAGNLTAITRAYLVFAQVLWPVWVPLAILLMEPERLRRRWLRGTLCMGAVAAAYYGWSLYAADPLASIDGHHIRYTVTYPWGQGLPVSVLYFVATVASVFVSSLRGMDLLGLALMITYTVARLSFPGNVISVWCYFAAVISAGIIFLLLRYRAAHRALNVEPTLGRG